MKIFPKIVIGHNNFFGVDHLSKSRGKSRFEHFSDLSNIEEIIDYCIQNGAEGMMLSTHERSKFIIDILKKKKLKIYPLLPYMQKYVTTANNKGLVGTVNHYLFKQNSFQENIIKTLKLLKGSIFLNDFTIFSQLIETELSIFKDLNLHCIFLHDGLVDICLALDQKEIILSYIDYIETKYNCHAGFATKNFPFFIEKLSNWGVKSPKVMSHINSLGFNMNPSIKKFEETIIKKEFNFMAMSSLASGYSKPSDAYRYIGKFNKIESICVGVSSKKHVVDTFNTIKKYI
jgi:hypothetical protein